MNETTRATLVAFNRSTVKPDVPGETLVLVDPELHGPRRALAELARIGRGDGPGAVLAASVAVMVTAFACAVSLPLAAVTIAAVIPIVVLIGWMSRGHVLWITRSARGDDGFGHPESYSDTLLFSRAAVWAAHDRVMEAAGHLRHAGVGDRDVQAYGRRVLWACLQRHQALRRLDERIGNIPGDGVPARTLRSAVEARQEQLFAETIDALTLLDRMRDTARDLHALRQLADAVDLDLPELPERGELAAMVLLDDIVAELSSRAAAWRELLPAEHLVELDAR